VVRMLSDAGIFLYTQAIFIAIAFWESHIDTDGWAKTQQGWRINLGIRELTAYHFWSWGVMIPLFLILPIAIYGWNAHLFWLLVASALIGTVVEDTLWFVVNPKFGIKKWNSHYGHWHKWVKLGRFEVPDFVIFFPIAAILIWWFLL
jgi:hypothetical protein